MGGVSSISQPRHHEPTYTQDVPASYGMAVRNHDPGDAVDDRDVNANTSEPISGLMTRNSFSGVGEGGINGCELFFLMPNLAPLMTPWRSITGNLRLYFDSHTFLTDAPNTIQVGRLVQEIAQTLTTFNRARGQREWPQAPSAFGDSRPWRGTYLQDTPTDRALIQHQASEVEQAIDRTMAFTVRSFNIVAFIDAWRDPDLSVRAQNFGIVVRQSSDRLGGGSGRINWGGDGYAIVIPIRYTYQYG